MTTVYRHLDELLGVELSYRRAAVESESDLSNSARPGWVRGTPVLEAEATPIADGNDDNDDAEVEATPILQSVVARRG